MKKPVIRYLQDTAEPMPLNIEVLRVLARSVSEEHQLAISWINFIHLDPQAHTELNRNYLKHDYETDVLTFDFSENGEVCGEIYVNGSEAKRNAASHGVTTASEFYRLFVHGMLHLAGMDDQSAEDRSNMQKWEDLHLKRSM